MIVSAWRSSGLEGEEVALFAAAISIVAACLSWISFKRSLQLDENSTAAALFLQLRSQYKNFYSRLHERIPDLHYADEINLPKSWGLYTEEQKLLAKEYWIISFNEWFASTKFATASSISLWEEFYGPAIASALRHYVLRRALEEAIDSLYSFGRDEHKFVAALYAVIEKDIATLRGQDPEKWSLRHADFRFCRSRKRRTLRIQTSILPNWTAAWIT